MKKSIFTTATTLKNESIRQLCAHGKTKKEAKQAYLALLEHARETVPEGHRVKVFFIEHWDHERMVTKAYYDWEFNSSGHLKSALPIYKEKEIKKLKDFFYEPAEGVTQFTPMGQVAAAKVRKECIELIAELDSLSKEAASEYYDKLFAMAKAESGLDIWALDCAYNAATGGLDYKYWV